MQLFSPNFSINVYVDFIGKCSGMITPQRSYIPLSLFLTKIYVFPSIYCVNLLLCQLTLGKKLPDAVNKPPSKLNSYLREMCVSPA